MMPGPVEKQPRDHECIHDAQSLFFGLLSPEDIDDLDILETRLDVADGTALLRASTKIQQFSEKPGDLPAFDDFRYKENPNLCKFRSSTWRLEEGAPVCKPQRSLLPGRSATNHFIVDIFVQVASSFMQGQNHLTTSRRCLLDTGADLNVITAAALEGLQFVVQPIPRQQLRGLAGTTDILNTICLGWHLSRDCDPLRRGRLNRSTMFEVIDPIENCTFDCVLGRPWIEQNMLIFLWICVKSYILPGGLRSWFSWFS